MPITFVITPLIASKSGDSHGQVEEARKEAKKEKRDAKRKNKGFYSFI